MLTLGFERLDMFSKEAVNREFPNLLMHYGENIDVHTKLYDGVENALQELIDRDFLLGVCTNKPEGLAIELLKRLGLSKYFKAMLGADTLPVRKPDPEHLWATIDRMGGDRKKAVLIGDTITDRNTAKNANLPCVLVGFGPLGDGVNQMEPEAILNNYFELPELMEKMLA